MDYWNSKGKYQNEYESLTEELLPPMGKSGTIGGEALRAVSRIYYDAYNNGFCNNTSDAWNYLDSLGIPELSMPLGVLETAVNTGSYTDFNKGDKTDVALDYLVDTVVKYLLDDPEVTRQHTEDDMNDFADPDVWEEEDEDEIW